MEVRMTIYDGGMKKWMDGDESMVSRWWNDSILRGDVEIATNMIVKIRHTRR